MWEISVTWCDIKPHPNLVCVWWRCSLFTCRARNLGAGLCVGRFIAAHRPWSGPSNGLAMTAVVQCSIDGQQNHSCEGAEGMCRSISAGSCRWELCMPPFSENWLYNGGYGYAWQTGEKRGRSGWVASIRKCSIRMLNNAAINCFVVQATYESLANALQYWHMSLLYS